MLIKRKFIFFFLLTSQFTYAQSDARDREAFIQCVDNQYGTNNLLLNGKPYLPKNLKAKGFPYFRYEDWKSGEIFIKGETFKEAKIKYNIESDLLILQKKLKNGVSVEVEMNENLVDSFSLEGHLFISQSMIPESQQQGYMEKIYCGSFAFYQVHKKLFDPVYTASKPFGQYSETQLVFFVVKNGKTEKINRESAFFDYFNRLKPGIAAFMDQNTISLKKASAQQLYFLMKFIDDEK